jgi:uncharacterized heparinase superfamily protein
MLRALESRFEVFDALRAALGATLQPIEKAQDIGSRLLRRWRPTRLARPIIPLVLGNPDLGRQIYRNRFSLAGQSVSGGTSSIFLKPVLEPAWLIELHGFNWLAHLQAAGSAMHRAYARTLVLDWMNAAKNLPEEARHSDVAAVRLMALVRHAPFLLQGAGSFFEDKFMRLIARETTQLAHEPGRIEQALALAYAVTAFDSSAAFRNHAYERLEAAMAEHILPDGGHVSRNPAVLLALLLDLVPLRSAIFAGREPLPQRLNAGIERMLPMLRFFCHGDDGLSVIQGVADPAVRQMRAVFGQDTTLGRPVSLAAYSGFARLAHGGAVVITDFGPDAACNGPLAFEFSDGPHRMIVNCGLPADGSKRWIYAASGPAAHNTLSLDSFAAEMAQGALARWASNLRKKESARRGVGETGDFGTLFRGGAVLDGSLLHERNLYLSILGDDFRGEDRLTRDAASDPALTGLPYVLRFHLHPSVKATLSQDGETVMLILPNRTAWRFAAKGCVIDLTDSVYLAGLPQPRRTQQIVLKGVLGRHDRVNWAFKRLAKRDKREAAESRSPELPF